MKPHRHNLGSELVLPADRDADPSGAPALSADRRFDPDALHFAR